MRINKNSEKRKNEILDAAENLFITKGYSKTTVNDILSIVGIAKGTFYYYFKSKEEVMNSMIIRFINIEVEAAKSIALDTSINAQEKMFKIIMAQDRDIDKKLEIIEELHEINNAEFHQKSLVETVLRLTPIITDVIEQGIKEGLFKTPYPKEVTEFLLVSSEFLFDTGIFKWKQSELLEKAKVFTYIVEKLLGAQKGSFSFIAKMYE